MFRPSRPHRSPQTSLHAGARPRLLVVEDEWIIAMDLADQLEELGYQVCATVDNGEAALANVEKHRPDLVLMDIVIKGELDGVDTAARIGLRYRVPVVFLTSYSDPTTLKRAMSTAPYGYVTKPFQLNELRGALEAALYKARLESRLRESERWFSATLRCAADGVLATDHAGLVEFLNPSAELTLGRQLDDVVGKPLAEVLPLEGEPLTRWPLGTADIAFGRWLTLANGRRMPIDVSFAPLRDEGNAVTGAVFAFRDVTQRLSAEHALQTSEERFRTAFDLAPTGMALVALSGRFLQGNAAMFQLLGQSEAELQATSQRAVTHLDDVENERQHLHQLLSGDVQTVQFEKRYLSRTRGEVWSLASVSLLSQADQPLCYLYQVHDLTERKHVEQQLTMLANHDALTGLANRAQLRTALEQALSGARRGDSKLAVVFLDLDRFKQVNDTLGHEAGDQVLQAVATRLRASVRDSDCIARLGGDEFVVLLGDVAGPDDALVATQKIANTIKLPIALASGDEVSVGVSMGVSMFPADGGDVRLLLRAADAALNHAKQQGRDNTQLYRSELTTRGERRAALELELTQALAGDELRLDFQPVFRLTDAAPLYVEALLRWHHPSRGLVLPRDFLPLVDQGRLGVRLCAWTLAAACRAAAELHRPGHRGLDVAVNVSLRQFGDDGFEAQLADALARTQVEPSRLCLELPAHLLRDAESAALAKALRVKASGVRIAVDDVGGGPLSLAALGRLSPVRLSIEGALVERITGATDDASTARAVIALAHALGISVVGKWIERAGQREALARAGCDAGQGFLLGRPGPLAAVVSIKI